MRHRVLGLVLSRSAPDTHRSCNAGGVEWGFPREQDLIRKDEARIRELPELIANDKDFEKSKAND